jgi:alpha-beta hydrolase superfamily lysophospholipase
VTYTEKIFSFGPSGSLRGILVEPRSRRIKNAPAILTWNVGLNHHVGPHRFFVTLTRSLAAQGFTSLRFDISGLGDSEVSRDDVRPDPERAVADVREAMAALTKQRDFQSFVPIGFCSSVDSAHVVGVSDPRVRAIIYLEGYGYRTRGFYLRYPLRFLSRDRWERLIRLRVLGDWMAAREASQEQERVYVRDYPSPKKLQSDIATMVARGARLLLVYVGGDTDYAYKEQFFEMIDNREGAGAVELDFYPNADHTFFLEEDRRRVIGRINDFLRQHFGSSERELAPESSRARTEQLEG